MSLDVYLTTASGTPIYDSNITHNLGLMASEAGIYKHLWRPDEIGVERAGELIEPLQAGLELLHSDEARFRQFDAPNGWGRYENLIAFVKDYLAACEQDKDAIVRVSR